MGCFGYMVFVNWDEVSKIFEDEKEKKYKDNLVIDNNPGLESS